MAEKITARLQTPANADGVRKDIHLMTTTDEVIVDYNTDYPRTLTEKLEEMGTNGTLGVKVAKEKPESPCVWVKITSTDK